MSYIEAQKRSLLRWHERAAIGHRDILGRLGRLHHVHGQAFAVAEVGPVEDGTLERGVLVEHASGEVRAGQIGVVEEAIAPVVVSQRQAFKISCS